MICMSMCGALKWWLEAPFTVHGGAFITDFFVLESILCSILGNGERIHFWEDFWIGESALILSFFVFFCF